MTDAPTRFDVELPIGGGDLLAPFDMLGFGQALLSLLRSTGVAGVASESSRLAVEWAKVAVDRSDVRPEPKDWRFKNRAWEDNPVYRRLGRSYLAWAQSVSNLVEKSDLDWRTKQRAGFLLNNLTAALSPTNLLLLNPDALERAFETGGLSVLRGWRNIGRDVVSNHGRPRSVDRGAFEVGRNLAATPGAVVYRNEVCELIQYAPVTELVWDTPVVVVPPQINKFYVMDLSPGRSFIEHGVQRGFQMFAISWRNPSRSDRRPWGLDAYVDALRDALTAAAEVARVDAVNVVGVCAGGLTTASLLAQQAATGQGLVGSATLAVTQIDYEIPSAVGMFGTPQVASNSARASAFAGSVEGAALEGMFAGVRPNDLIWNYWVQNNLCGDDPSAFDVLAWNADSTALPAPLHAQYLEICQRNLLARGELEVLGSVVDLANVECDSLFVAGRTDHLVPWQACYANTKLFGGSTEFVLSSSGHIQCLVNPPGSPRMSITVGPATDGGPEDWLAGATETPGVWWEHWAEWQGPRSGCEHRAPKGLGSRKHPAGVAAPGDYVLNR